MRRALERGKREREREREVRNRLDGDEKWRRKEEQP